MSSLAEFLCKNYTITGSDLSKMKYQQKLKKRIKVYEHQLAENIIKSKSCYLYIRNKKK